MIESESCQPQICRLCLAYTTTCFSLIDKNEESEMLHALTSLNILPTDEISTIMCLKCRLNLKLAFFIQQNMLKAEQRFREIKQEHDIFTDISIDSDHPKSEEEFIEDNPKRQKLQEVPKIWACDICGTVKPTRRHLEKHKYNVHLTQKCSICDKVIKQINMKRHIERHKSTPVVLELEQPFQEGHSQEKDEDDVLTDTITAFDDSELKEEFIEDKPNREEPQKENVPKIWTCDICGTVKPTRDLLRKHKYNVHLKEKCPTCDKVITQTNMKRHIERHKRTPVVSELEQKLREGSSQWKQEDNVLTDTVNASDDPKPDEEFIKDNPKNQKAQKENVPNIWTCDICGTVKPTRRHLGKHKYDVHLKQKCSICHKVIRHAYLKHHMERHKNTLENNLTVPKIWKCDICGNIKSTKSDLRKHKYNVHLKQKCSICDKIITQTNLKRHIERHTIAPVVCELCGATVHIQDMRFHLNRRHKGLSYSCSFCGKAFKCKKSKSAHEKREHLDQADFVCDMCGKRFYKSSALKHHFETIHLKLRPHICDFCKTGFSSKCALRTHRRQHTNETPYKCEVCGLGFKQKVSLRSHLKSRHQIEEELTCKCSLCGKEFASKVALVSHSRIHQ